MEKDIFQREEYDEYGIPGRIEGTMLSDKELHGQIRHIYDDIYGSK
jgi:hypothetical protein